MDFFMMKCLLKLLGLIIVLASCTSESSRSTPMSIEVTPRASPIPVATPTPDYKAAYGQQVETFYKQYGFNTKCTPYCWKNFVPGEAPMSDIFSFLESINMSDTGTRGDPTLPLNVTGFGAGAAIYAFSDNSQPPKLRALSLQMGLPITDLGIDLGIDYWLPQNIIKRGFRPVRIFYAHGFSNFYFLLLDFNTWAVEYNGPGIIPKAQVQACPNQRLPNIIVWSYSISEANSWSLITDLTAYPASDNSVLDWTNGPQFTSKDYVKTVSSSPQLDKMITQLASQGCVDLN